MVRPKDTDIGDAKRGKAPEQEGRFDLLVDKCPKWFLDRMYAALDDLQQPTYRGKTLHERMRRGGAYL